MIAREAGSNTIRLNKAIARAGLASRRSADEMITQGRVRLNGEVVTDLGTLLEPGRDLLEVDGNTVRLEEKPRTEVWALYKPKNCVSTMDDPRGRPTIRDHFPRTKARLFPVGRLDYDAEGLILLTNDGDLAQRVAHPSAMVKKVYLVKVKGLVSPQALAQLAEGPVLDGRRKKGVRARVLHVINDKTWLEVKLTEGIQHHIKKAFASIGNRVLKIKRYQIGQVTLGELEPGQTRLLSAGDVETLVAGPSKSRRKKTSPPQRQKADDGVK
ncbi:MAG: rRNA pseudouridine synthase [Deltaproteobacteria bacterium]|nr:rRNA pseudouridine synthase [Deltaproteobacteria bacterium]